MAREVRRTLVGVLGRENVIIRFTLPKGLLSLNGHTDKLAPTPREGRGEDLVSTLNRDIVKIDIR